MAYRHDLVEISPPRLDQNGYLVADAFPTRVGVFKYVKPDGTVTRELRHEDDVFKPESLESLKHRPIIDEHPDGGPANATNTGRLSVGHVGEQVAQQDDHVKANVIITDQRMIEKMQGKGGQAKRELSCGYQADVIQEEGTYQGEQYDHRQTNIVYNHLASVWKGRAGPTARIHLDSEDATIEGLNVDIEDDLYRDLDPEMQKKLSAKISKLVDEGKPQNEAVAIAHKMLGISRKTDREDAMTIKRKLQAVAIGEFRLDQLEIGYPEESGQVIDALVARNDKLETELKVVADKYGQEKSAKEKAEGERDHLQEEAKKKGDGLDHKKLDALAAVRAELMGVAGHLGIKGVSDMDNHQIKQAVVAQHNPDLKLDDLSVENIEGRFGMICDGLKRENKSLESLAQLKAATSFDPKRDNDGGEETPSPRAAYLEDIQDLHGKTEKEVKADWADRDKQRKSA